MLNSTVCLPPYSASRRDTSVIAKIRHGAPAMLGLHTISMVISEELQQYQDILSIGFSSKNIVLGLNSPAIQLAVLYSPVIEGPDFFPDIRPWCPEYENYDLPWIIKQAPKGMLQIFLYNLMFRYYLASLLHLPYDLTNTTIVTLNEFMISCYIRRHSYPTYTASSVCPQPCRTRKANRTAGFCRACGRTEHSSCIRYHCIHKYILNRPKFLYLKHLRI